MSFIVISKNAQYNTKAIVAPTGYYRKSDGTVERDNTPSPEMGPIQLAYRFQSHRSAARSASRLSDPIIKEISY